MLMLGGLLAMLGAIIILIGFLGLVFQAYQESIVWLILIFVPLAGLIFVVLNWDEAKGPFLCIVLGFAIRFVGSGLISVAMQA